MAELPNLPGVKINEVQLGSPPITGVSTSRAGFVGNAPKNNVRLNEAFLVTSADQFIAEYIKGTNEAAGTIKNTDFSHAVLGFFRNGGSSCYIVNVASTTPTPLPADVVTGIKVLEARNDVQIIAAPGSADQQVYAELIAQAESKGDRFAILDAPAKTAISDLKPGGGKRPTTASAFAAFYYPRIQVPPQLPADPQPPANLIYVAPTGHIAGVYARTDAARGVHKAPANERILGALGVEHLVSDSDQNELNAEGVDVVRQFTEGSVVWGVRTFQASNADKTFQYLNIRRLTTFIEQSLKEGLRFAVFEPNNLALRKTITRSVRGFLDGVWRDGALFGATADEAYYVRFPDSFNTDAERAAGKLVIEIGIRVSFPVEFLIIRIGLLSQSASAA